LDSTNEFDRFISSVDNGWLAASLIAAGEAFPALKA